MAGTVLQAWIVIKQKVGSVGVTITANSDARMHVRAIVSEDSSVAISAYVNCVVLRGAQQLPMGYTSDFEVMRVAVAVDTLGNVAAYLNESVIATGQFADISAISTPSNVGINFWGEQGELLGYSLERLPSGWTAPTN